MSLTHIWVDYEEYENTYHAKHLRQLQKFLVLVLWLPKRKQFLKNLFDNIIPCAYLWINFYLFICLLWLLGNLPFSLSSCFNLWKKYIESLHRIYTLFIQYLYTDQIQSSNSSDSSPKCPLKFLFFWKYPIQYWNFLHYCCFWFLSRKIISCNKTCYIKKSSIKWLACNFIYQKSTFWLIYLFIYFNGMSTCQGLFYD